MKTISVVIPTYQHAKTINLAIESIFSQGRTVDEIIVVDDGSTDNTKEVLQPYLDRITYIYQSNQGAQSARNNGFRKSLGDYVIFWDADVIGQKDMINKFEKALEVHKEASWAYSNFYWGSIHFKSKIFDKKTLREENYIHTTSLIRREDFLEFDITIKRFQDWDLWLTMSGKNRVGFWVNETLYKVLLDVKRNSISSWLPKFIYKIPWKYFGWKPSRVREYEKSREVILKKHHL